MSNTFLKKHASKFAYVSIALVGGILSGWLSSSRADLALQNTAQPQINNIQTYFTPWDNAEAELVKAMDNAKQSIHIQTYVWTSKVLNEALLRAHKRGVVVKMLADKTQLRQGSSLVPKLVAEGVPVKIEVKYRIAHNKIMIIDVETDQAKVITGSYNFSQSAQKHNAENILFIDSKAMAETYLNNWLRHEKDALAY